MNQPENTPAKPTSARSFEHRFIAYSANERRIAREIIRELAGKALADEAETCSACGGRGWRRAKQEDMPWLGPKQDISDVKIVCEECNGWTLVAVEQKATPAEPSPVDQLREELAAFYTPAEIERWLNQPNPQLDGLTPLEAIEAGRFEDIRAGLRRMAEGVYL